MSRLRGDGVRGGSDPLPRFFLQKGEFGLGTQHPYKDEGKARQQAGSEGVAVEDNGQNHPEYRLQGEDDGGGGGLRPHQPHVHQRHADGGGNDAQVEHGPQHLRPGQGGEIKGFGGQGQRPGAQGDGSQLDRGKEHHVLALTQPGHGDDVGGAENGAAQREQVAAADGERLGEGDEAYSGQAQQSGGDVVPVGPLPEEDPGHKGDDHAVHRREKGAVGGGGGLQPHRLGPVDPEEQQSRQTAPPQVVGREVFPAPPADEGYQRGARRKADGDQVAGGDAVRFTPTGSSAKAVRARAMSITAHKARDKNLFMEKHFLCNMIFCQELLI